MNEEQKARVQELVAELDSLVPRTDAVVVLRQYGGGCDESEMISTETGYLRLGIELLKAPLLPSAKDDKEALTLDVDWEYLIAERSDIGFHLFHLDNTLEPDAAFVPEPKPPWKNRAAELACSLVCLLLMTVFGAGVIAIMQWIFR